MPSNPSIPRYEVSPETDEEWAEALKDYGRDRDDLAHAKPPPLKESALQKPLLFDSSVAFNASPSSSPGPSAPPLIHHVDSFESLHDPALSRTAAPRNDSLKVPTSRSSTRAPVPIPAPTENGVIGLNLGLSVDVEDERHSHRGSFGSDDSMFISDEPAPALGIAYTIGGPRRPPSAGPDMTEEERRSSEAERTKLRSFYEKEGWLPGPQPGRITQMRRKRAIRRLGLCCTQEEAKERQTVLAKYAELAKQIFNTSQGSVSILHTEDEVMWSMDPEAPVAKCPADQAACSHAVLFPDVRCTVVADMSKDWRFRNNPTISKMGMKFYASAPLRYRRNDIAIDFGTLCIYDEIERDTFDSREKSILLNLANMLVYQLTTLQSEIMAKKSSSMYEQSISFLRRSVTTRDPSKHLPEEQKAQERESRREKKREYAKSRMNDRSDRSRSDGPNSQLSPKSKPRPKRPPRINSKKSSSTMSQTSASEPVLAVKTGPRDSKDAKRVAALSDQALFTDAAQTLRGILKADAVAIVNIDEYQLFIKRSSGSEHDHPKGKRIKGETKEAIIGSFLQGKPWPAEIEPVIHYVPKTSEAGVQVLGTDSGDKSTRFHFDTKGAEGTLGEFIRSYLKSRHFWWDREDSEDELSLRIMDLMPGAAQTTLASVFITPEGKTRFAMFVSWNRPPSEFGDSSTIALPFAWILGGCTMAALAIRKVRQLEQSQISYSNLQAHELRTPLHQILAITQLLRSSMNDLADTPHQAPNQVSSLTTTQQIRDLLPFLDAIDTSGKTLHGIVDNILSFLDLKGKDNMLSPTSPSLLTSPSGVTQSIEVMFEELIHDACEEDKRSRRANGQPMCNVETVFEVIPPLLGEQVTEDAGGALRRALAKILSNAYKFIEGEGCVEIYVDDVPSLLPPEGCEDLALSKRISIKIVDNGKGMDHSFVREKLGEPWAKEDPYATGSGLSVHLAYRIIDLMGGQMEVVSGPGQGCTVLLEVPVPRRAVITPTSPELTGSPKMSSDDPSQLAAPTEAIELCRKVALVGFDSAHGNGYGLQRLFDALEHQYTKLGCKIVDSAEAELLVVEGRLEEIEEDGVKVLSETDAKDIIFLVGQEHEAHPNVFAQEQKLGKTVRRFRKPATPSILRESLFPGQSKALLAEIPKAAGGTSRSSINSPEQVDSHGRTASTSSTSLMGSLLDKPKTQLHFSDAALLKSASQAKSSPDIMKDTASSCPIVARLATLWKPRNMDVEDAVASLSLGDYFSSRKRSSLNRTPSNASSNNTVPSTPTMGSHELGSTPNEDAGTPLLGTDTDPTDVHMTPGGESLDSHERGWSNHGHDGEHGDHEFDDEEEHEEEEPETVKVMVVEDNVVNRRILVKILSSKLPIEVLEAEDGKAAVEIFKELTSPAIVLLDINMPKMDGYQACLEMRAIEKERGNTPKSQIIAVTALGGEAEKHRGLVECGMNQWHTKPCSKAKIHEIVEDARALLLEARAVVNAL